MYTKSELRQKFGYTQIKGLQNLVDIWNIIGEDYVFYNGYLTLRPEILDKIEDYLNNNKILLTKPWYSYTNKTFSTFNLLSWEEYEKEIEAQKILEKDLFLLEELKEQYKDEWVSEDWIRKTIGRYKTPLAQYYWTLIGLNGFQVVDWKGNIKIRKDIYDKILKDKTFSTYSGENFIKEKFSNKKGYPAIVKGTFIVPSENYGIYGIYYENELIYVGMTQKGFEARWQEHKDIFSGAVPAPLDTKLYTAGLELNKVEFKELINIKDLDYEGAITYQELKAMELACIHIFKPKYNICGLSKPYIM